MRDVIQPLRQKFIAYLAEGQRRGVIRPSRSARPSAPYRDDLRRGPARGRFSPGYTREVYLKTCVDLFLEGVSIRQACVRECK